jgi:NagD protein
MNNYGLLIDMDGVIYRGGTPIPGAVDFVNSLVRYDIPFLFLTNNSQRTRLDIAIKIQRMGFKVTKDHIYTCAMSTARFLSKQKENPTAFVLGEGGLMHALNTNNVAIVDKDADYVVVGEGRSYTFEMLEQATNLVLNGAKLIATNMDPNCPTANGTRPGCGAIVKLLEVATGREAFDLGKPNPIMMRDARKLLGLKATHTIMIGDTMSTDIIGGIQLGYHSILVLSGGTKKESLDSFAFTPDSIVGSLAELNIEILDKIISSKIEEEALFS